MGSSYDTSKVKRKENIEPARRHIYDVKTIHVGGALYRTPRARDERAGAVAERAHRVGAEYARAARELDTRFHAPGTPVATRLDELGAVRSFVFGGHGEVSPDVHAVLRAAARAAAERSWARDGARSADEAYSFYLQRFRRELCLVSVREFARHRLHRLPFIGVPRAHLRDRPRRPPVRDVDDFGFRPADFFAYQAFGVGA